MVHEHPGEYQDFTARVAKRAKVMFSQVFVILSLTEGGGGDRWVTPMVNHLPPLGPGQNIYPPPPGPGQNIYPPPPTWDQVRTSTPPGTRSEHLLPPPPGPGQNI